MKTYKRRISNDFGVIFNDDGTSQLTPKSIQIFLTQSIEDIGIYEDFGGDDMVTHENPGDLNVDIR
jgi:hypothetical protein